MTSRSLYFNLVKEDGKQRLWVFALAFLIYFFTLPVGAALKISGQAMETGADIQNITKGLIAWFSLDNGFLVFCVAFFSLLLGVTGFSYLHSKQKVDFYHGLAVSRTKLFFVNYIGGILIPAVSYLVNLLLGLLVAGFTGFLTKDVAAAAFTGYGFFMLHYLMLYSFTVLAMILTGNKIVGILGIAVFSAYFPVMLFLLELCYQKFSHSYRYGSGFLADLMDKLSPHAAFFGNLFYWSDLREGRIIRLAAVAAVFLVVTVLCVILYRRRGSEAAGKAMAFRISMPVVRIPLVFLCGFAGCALFWIFDAGPLWVIFGLLCGTVISHCIIEIIYHFDFKKLFSHRLSMGLCALAAGAVFSVFYFDLLGFEGYLPKAEEVSYAAVSSDYTDDWMDYGNFLTDRSGTVVWKDEAAGSYLLEHMQLKDFADVLALAEEGIRGTQETESYGGNITYYSICFQLKNGRRVYRSYEAEADKVDKLLKGICELPEYKKTFYPILAGTDGALHKIRFSQDQKELEIGNGSTVSPKEILEAYQEELKNLKQEEMEKETPIAQIQFVTDLQSQAEKEELDKYGPQSWSYKGIYGKCEYPVYPSFTKTIELLTKAGAVIWKPEKPSSVELITVDSSQFVLAAEENTKAAEANVFSVNIDDPVEIEELLSNALYAEYAYMDPALADTDYYYFNTVDETNLLRCYRIDADRVPEFLKERIRTVFKGEPVTVFD